MVEHVENHARWEAEAVVMNNVIPFPRTKMLRTNLRLVQPDDDVRVTFARMIEEKFHAMENTMAGDDPRPSDGAA